MQISFCWSANTGISMFWSPEKNVSSELVLPSPAVFLCLVRLTWMFFEMGGKWPLHTHTHTHTHIYIYIYICVCVFKGCSVVWLVPLLILFYKTHFFICYQPPGNINKYMPCFGDCDKKCFSLHNISVFNSPTKIWFGLVWFHALLNIVCYSMPNNVYTYILNIYDF